jgi:hypothetical protein
MDISNEFISEFLKKNIIITSDRNFFPPMSLHF